MEALQASALPLGYATLYDESIHSMPARFVDGKQIPILSSGSIEHREFSRSKNTARKRLSMV